MASVAVLADLCCRGKDWGCSLQLITLRFFPFNHLVSHQTSDEYALFCIQSLDCGPAEHHQSFLEMQLPRLHPTSVESASLGMGSRISVITNSR